MKKIVVTGGGGYIGSFMVKRLLDLKNDVLVIDSLVHGYKEVIDDRAQFVQGDLGEKAFIHSIFEKAEIEAVIHFAGYISMAESMQNPGKYFVNNTYSVVNLLEEMKEHNINNFIFSSTAGVYGNPQHIPIKEDDPKNPTNPYGESKLMVEQILKWYMKIFSINFISLRYFNASGAALDGSMGERHIPETHIIPNAIRAILQGKEFTLYGNDYDTHDGTCVRDYIHVLDLVEAHVLALKRLYNNAGGYIYNVGTGKGYSNKEVLNMIQKISNQVLEITVKEKRLGDAAILIADPTLINSELNFVPKYSDLETIVKTAWNWHTGQK